MKECLLRRVGVWLLLFASFSGWVWASSKESQVPITIEARRMTVDNKKGLVRFEGDVVAVKGDMRVSCDAMEISFNKKGEMEKIVAVGNVEVRVKDKIVTSKKAVYYAKEEKIVFTGAPKAWLGKNVVSGDKIIYFIRDDRSIVESEGKEKKVNAVIVPEKGGKNAEGSKPE